MTARQIKLYRDAKGQDTLVSSTLSVNSEELITVSKSFFKDFLRLNIAGGNVL